MYSDDKFNEAFSGVQETYPDLQINIARTIISTLNQGVEESTRVNPFNLKQKLSHLLDLFKMKDEERVIYRKLVIAFFGKKYTDSSS